MIQNWPAPEVSTRPGAIEHTPVPEAQPAWAAVYHVRTRPPELSSSHSIYCAAPATAVHLKVGAALSAVSVPDGAISVAWPGGSRGTVKVRPALHGPLPDAFAVITHHCPLPGLSTTPGVIEHVPDPLAQPACAAVYVVRMRPPVASSTHSRYCVAAGTAFQT